MERQKMDQNTRLRLEQKLNDDWENRWFAKGYFDPENPTREQLSDQFREMKKVFPEYGAQNTNN